MIHSKNSSKTILKTIKNYGPLTCKDISKITNFNIPKVTVLVNNLLFRDLVEKVETPKKRGRPPKLIQIKSDMSFFIGINIDSENIRIILVDINGTVLNKLKIKTEPDSGIKNILNNISLKLEELTNVLGININKISGIGLSTPSAINKKTGKIIVSSNLGWSNINLKELAENKFNLPVTIETSDRAMSYAEKKFGIARSFSDFFFIEIGAGIGSCIFLNNKLYTRWGNLQMWE